MECCFQVVGDVQFEFCAQLKISEIAVQFPTDKVLRSASARQREGTNEGARQSKRARRQARR